MDFSGCGNTFNCNHPLSQKLIIDCLRYWVRETHVDGFRFDEGSILSRGEDGAPAVHPPLVWQIELDEDLADTKLIAEAWDAAGLYQIGHFPGDRWAEWNGRYRDDVRRFVRGDPGVVGAVASRLGGSADIYEERGGSPLNSVNFVTCHDGFTLNDLVSYNQKHNEANGESNRDGINDNLSWNCGAEGDSDDPNIESLRNRQVRNFWRSCCSRAAFQCSWRATRYVAHRTVTTTRIARITRSAGSTGLLWTRTPICSVSVGT